MNLTVSAFGHTETFQLAVNALSAPQRQIEFRVVTERLKGLAWSISLDDAGPGKCEAATAGEYRYERLPVPRFLFTFGMEVIFKSMAERLRDHIERLQQSNGQRSFSYERIRALGVLGEG
jgi:hypothetical protein